jgi:hypothetical protein
VVKRKSKGLAEMKTVTSDTPASAPTPAQSEPESDPLPTAPAPAPAPAPAHDLLDSTDKKVRCELKDARATKNPTVFEITLSGEYNGSAYHQVGSEPLPAAGAILDLVIEEVPSMRDPGVTVHKVISLTIVG